MARKVNRLINRFDGGITDDIRNTSDLSKCAHVAHFDIYSNPYRLQPMPGYVADQDTVSGGADDLQNYNIKGFYYQDTLYAVGTKSNGTGSKVFQKATPTTASWTASTGGEGTYLVRDYTFVTGDFPMYMTTNGGSTYITRYDGASAVTDAHATLYSGTTNIQTVQEPGMDGVYYVSNGRDDITKIAADGAGTVTDPIANSVETITDIQNGDAQIGFIGYKWDPYRAIFTVWDMTANPNETLYKYDLGPGFPVALGRLGSQWIAIISNGIEQNSRLEEAANGNFSFKVVLTNGPTSETLVTVAGATDTNAELRATRGYFNDAMLFYGRIPEDATPTSYKEGIWAVGKRNSTSPLALSLLLDTSSLGSIEAYYNFGFHHFFAHNGDGSVSRLDAFGTGTYDVTATYESLVFGSETPFEKVFNGISVVTENLPSGGSVVCKYRTDTDDSWTTIATSSTLGTQRHNFTRTSSGPIGNFTEFQFRVEVTGKCAIKNITLAYEETDSLPYSL